MLRVEGDYIWFDGRKIARMLPSLALGDLRAAERAIQSAQLPGEDDDEPEAPSVEAPAKPEDPALEKLRKLAAISGGLLSWDEIEDALS